MITVSFTHRNKLAAILKPMGSGQFEVILPADGDQEIGFYLEVSMDCICKGYGKPTHAGDMLYVLETDTIGQAVDLVDKKVQEAVAQVPAL